MSAIKILDAAMGTELIQRGCELPKHIWSAHINLTNPNLIYQIHKKHIDSGAEYITTNTFRTTARSFSKMGCSLDDAILDSKKSLKNALIMAHKARGSKDVKILGSIAPLEDCYTPKDYPGDDVAYKEFHEIGKNLIENKIDAFLLETMNSISETKTCLDAIEKFEIPVWVSYNLLDDKHILSGDRIKDAIKLISKYKVAGILLNCNSISDTLLAIPEISQNGVKEWGVYPNIGLGKPSPDGLIENYASMDDFLNLSDKAVELGATILGGCCGSTSKHIQALKDRFI